MSLPPPPAAAASGAPLSRQLTGMADAVAAASASSVDSPKLGSDRLAAPASSLPADAVFDMRIAGVTDPGVAGKQNQDDFFLWESADRQTIFAGVFDGHGREMGQIAAKVAKASVRDELTRADVIERLNADPHGTLVRAFDNAHRAIEESFKAFYEEQGWYVTRSADGYLMRSKTKGGAPMCVHGGTTATLVVILGGRRIIISNVGDSTAIMVGLGAAGALRSAAEWTPLPGFKPAGTPTLAATPVAYGTSPAAPSTSSVASAAPMALRPGAASPLPVPASVASSYMELSADHSPESHTEFQRMHRFRPHTTLPYHPELLFVYDTLSASKLGCPAIFDVDMRSGNLSKTERGSYYKNVRCEWATLVATPPHAPYQDALAFTRSLGDLHLQTYGVSHEPETWWMDLTAPGDASPGAAASGTGRSAPVVSHPLSLVLSSDGIWDNWKFEEVAAFALTPARVAEAARLGSAQSAANDLMAANLERGKANFGSSADNMTCIVAYLFPRRG